MNREEVVDFVKIVLRKRFHDNFEKQQVDDSNDRKLNFACPICGDSHKKSSKKRGNLYFDTEAYKCFNDGCMAYMSLAEFVSKMSREHGIMLPSFAADFEYKPVRVKRTENQLLRFLTSDTTELVTISEIINRFNLVRLDQAENNPRALEYIKSRNLDLIEDFGDFLYADSSDNKVLIFNFDRRSGKLLGLSIRSLDPNAERKYIIKSYTDIALIFLQREIDKELVDDANYLNNYFNILNVDFSKPLCLTEGQFDALFIRNCIATTGVTKARSILPSLGAKGKIRILFDKDKGGKEEMMNLIKQGYSVLLWNKIINDLKKKVSGKSDLIKLTKIKDINDLFNFLKERQPSLTVNEFNDFLNSYFSDSVYDIAFL
jgi:hypothetical protein